MKYPTDDTPAGGLGDAADGIVAGRAADGDVAAFTVLVQRFAPRMRAYARRVLGYDADVDDVVQESFVTAWQQLDRLNDVTKVRSWLMRITSRTAIDRLRANREHSELDDAQLAAPSGREPSRQAELRSEMEALDRALRELPDEQRQCWVLRELGGHSYDEIADHLDVPVSTVRGQLARARKFLLVRLEGWR